MIPHKRSLLEVFGSFFLLFGVILFLNSFSGITGFAVIEKTPEGVSGSIFGIAFIVAGVLMLLGASGNNLSGRKRKALSHLEIAARRGIGDYRELISDAKKLGYDIIEEKGHTGIYHGKKRVTGVPRHAKGVATGTYRSIARNLLRDYRETA